MGVLLKVYYIFQYTLSQKHLWRATSVLYMKLEMLILGGVLNTTLNTKRLKSNTKQKQPPEVFYKKMCF